MLKKLLLQLQQLGCELGAGAGAFVDGGQIKLEVGSAQLALMGGQVVVGREAIAHHRAGKAIAQQVERSCSRAAQTLQEYGHHRRHHHLEPIPLPCWIVANRYAQNFVYEIAGGGAGFIHVGHQLLAGGLQCFCCGLRQRCTQPLADGGDRPAADRQPQHLLQQCLALADTQREGTAQQTHQAAEPGPAADCSPHQEARWRRWWWSSRGRPTEAAGAPTPAA